MGVLGVSVSADWGGKVGKYGTKGEGDGDSTPMVAGAGAELGLEMTRGGKEREGNEERILRSLV